MTPTPEPPVPTPSATTATTPRAGCASGCNHCWHQWGSASGGISSEGSWARGTNRCCRCGEIEPYEYTVKVDGAAQHGPYYTEILRYPR